MNEEKNSLDEILQSHNNESEGGSEEIDVFSKLVSLFTETDDAVHKITTAITNIEKEEIERICGEKTFTECTNAVINLIMEHVSFMLRSCQMLGLAIKEDDDSDDDD